MAAPANSTQPENRAAWRQWLEAHHEAPVGVWLIFFKKASGKATFDYDGAVEEALCFGWIDSKPRKLDDERSMLWFAPRKANTGWSRPNKERVARLIQQGLMAPAGLAKVAAAQADGSWSALDAIEDLQIPTDLKEALAALPAAAENFDQFPRSAKRGILEWVINAKRPETRRARVAETARLASLNERAYQWKGSSAA